MPLSEKSITEAIKIAVQRVWNGPGRDELTVNQIRFEVEAKLDLDAGFLKDGSWKQKSKKIVLDEHERLLNESEKVVSSQPTSAKSKVSPTKESKPEPSKDMKIEPVKKNKTQPINTGSKRASEADKAQSRKKQKKKNIPSSDDEESELSSPEDTPNVSGDEYDIEMPKAKKASRTITKSAPKIQANRKSNTNNEKIGDEGVNIQNEETSRRRETTEKEKNEAESGSDMSVVLDEAPKPRTKSKLTSKGVSKPATAKSSNPPKATTSSINLSPDEELLKTLQSQLVKCGVRKIWGVVLREYGSDTKAKTRHLKGMLKDIGMEGRFSESRAKEIREARELRADLEAVMEGDAKWGMGREGRSKKANERKKVVESESDEAVEARSRSTSEKPPPRVARAKMDLAFLGDEESESD